MLRILVADDHAIFRDGLKLLLSSRAATSVVGEASSGPEAVRLASELKPDLIILDVAMPGGNGIDAVPRIRESAPGAKIIVLSTFEEERVVVELLDAGAHAYVLKAGAFAELDAAILQVMGNHRYLSPSISDTILSSYLSSQGTGRTTRNGPLERLSERERTVFRLICEGKPPKAIGAELGISRKTVDIHKRNLMAKLDLDSDIELIKLGLREGLVPETRSP